MIEFISIRKVAEKLSVDRSTVERWIKRGLLPSTRLGGELPGDRATIRIRTTDVDEFIKRGELR